jgi:hypothetical protein
LSLSGLFSFTLEGWYHPTLLGDDLMVVPGQVDLTEAVLSRSFRGSDISLVG